MSERTKAKNIGMTFVSFLISVLCEIGYSYLVWLWFHDGMTRMLGAIRGFVFFLYGIVPTFQPSQFHRIYAAYGVIFIVMALTWGSIFEGLAPDTFDITATAIALVGIGAFIMFVYGIIPTHQPSEFGRVNAAYGGIL